MTQLVRKLGRNDVKLIGRDRFLIFMFFFVIYIAVMLRYGMPWLNDYLMETGALPSEAVPHSLADFYPLLISYMAIYTGGLLVGTVYGFVLLDEKDDNTLTAMMVTPVPLQHYILYRVGMPALLAFVIIFGMVLFINQALIPIGQLLLISAGGALTAPIVSLFFGTFAANKVQGFAYSKFVGISGWIIMLGFFVAEPAQWLLGLFPPFWVSKAYWMALAGQNLWWMALLIGIVWQAVMIGLLIRRFNRMAYR
jgi:fluoroquinolone transport system permease protein